MDEVLDPPATAEVETHLAECPRCAAQAEEERALRVRLRALPAPELPAGLELAVRRSLRPRRRWPWVALPLAAGLVLAVWWVRGTAPVLAWQLGRDHGHCFGKPRLPAQVWGSEPAQVAAWFAERGRDLPHLPDGSAAGVTLLGGRFCPLADRRVAHVYYEAGEHAVSLFVVPEPARFEGTRRSVIRGRTVHLMHLGGEVVALVSEEASAVDALEGALTTTVADGRVRHLARR